MSWLFDPCWRHRRNLALLASGVLPDAEKDQMARHLAGCTTCQSYFAEAKSLVAPLRNWEGEFKRLEPTGTVRARWEAAIHAAGHPKFEQRQTPAGAVREWCREVVRPYRRIWAALAAVWVLILAGQFSLREHPQIEAAKSISAQQRVTLAFKERQKILMELLSDHPAPREADRPKIFTPRP